MLNREEYPYSWMRYIPGGMEGGQYAKANGDGTVTVLQFSATAEEQGSLPLAVLRPIHVPVFHAL